MRSRHRLSVRYSICFLVLLAGVSFAEFDTPAFEDPEAPAEILIGLGYGFSFPYAYISPFGISGIRQGFLLDDPIRRIFIRRAIHERLFLNFDYDAERGGDFLFGGGNLYSLLYRGGEGEFLRELTLGNEALSFPDGRFVTVDAGNRQSFAVRAIGGADGFGVEGMLRYGRSLQATKRFRGGGRVVEAELLDVDYARGRFFLLPDSGIDEDTLRLLKSASGVSDLTIDGKRFAYLLRDRDFAFDGHTGTISMERPLGNGEELLIHYEKNGYPVGSDQLGALAVIDEAGVRVDFRVGSFPDFGGYFASDGGLDYLYLKKDGFNSYWEMRNGYPLEGLGNDGTAGDVSVRLAITGQGGANANYQDLLREFEIRSGHIFLNFTDGVGLYTRPFPGLFPFTHPTTPGNPFDPSNPVYGGVDYPQAEDSINTLEIRYTLPMENYFLDFDIIEGSIEVAVDGIPLGSDLYEVDYPGGIITFDEEAVGPFADIVVRYRYTPFGGAREELFSAVNLHYDSERISISNLTSFQWPLVEVPAPRIGFERQGGLKNSSDFSLALGAGPDDNGPFAAVRGSAALSLGETNSRDAALIAAMSEDLGVVMGLSDRDWSIASPSQLLAALPVPLGTRGRLLFENYWESSELRGDILHELSWDNSSNPFFPYAEKAGPYNTSDHPDGGEETSLVLDYEFAVGSTDPYVSVVRCIPSTGLRDVERMNLTCRGDEINGDSVRIYVEVMRVLQEDLNGNDVLDGESSGEQAGFTITPMGGEPTVMGTDREGEADGKIDSEDLNRNAYLDPLGAYATDQEEGAVLRIPAGFEYVLELTPGDEEWKRISVDIRDVVANDPDIFRDAGALRVTVKPLSAAPAAAVSGKILINGIRLVGSGMINGAPTYVALREISVMENEEVRANAFSLSFPEVYRKLHGRESLRETSGHEEKILEFRLTSDLPGGLPAPARISRRFDAPKDLSFYRSYRMYLYLPSGQSLPPDAAVTIGFESAAAETLEAEIRASEFSPGWNEILVSLEPPYTVTVDGTSAGELMLSGTLDVLRRVAAVTLGLKAGATVIPADFRMWLDEWHVSESRLLFDQAFAAEGSAGFRGALLSAGSVSLLGDLFLDGGLEWRGPGFLGSTDSAASLLYADVGAGLLSLFRLDVRLSRLSAGPRDAARDLGFPLGEKVSRYSHGLTVDSGIPYLPVLEHTFRRLVTNAADVELNQVDYLLGGERRTVDTFVLEQRHAVGGSWLQDYSFSRTWTHDARRSYLPDGSLAGQSESLTFEQVHDGGAVFRKDGMSVRLDMSRVDGYETADARYPYSILESFAVKTASAFRRAEKVLPDGELVRRTDTGLLSLSLLPESPIGAELDAEARFRETAFDHGAGTRSIEVVESLGASFPLTAAEGRVVFTPRLSRSFEGGYTAVREPLEEHAVFLETYRTLLKPPFHYLSFDAVKGRLRELAAVDVLGDAAEILGSSRCRLGTMLGLDLRLASDFRLLPTLATFALGGETAREGTGYAASRNVSLGLFKTQVFDGGNDKLRGTATVGGGYEHGRDFTAKLLESDFSANASLDLNGKRGGRAQGDLVLSYSRVRQRTQDERLALTPGDPSPEPAVPFEPDRDSLHAEIALSYLWSGSGPVESGDPGPAEGDAPSADVLSHREKVVIETRWTSLNPKAAEDLTNQPFRITAEHVTRVVRSENLELDLGVRLAGGMDERITGGLRSLHPSFGFELTLDARFLF